LPYSLAQLVCLVQEKPLFWIRAACACCSTNSSWLLLVCCRRSTSSGSGQPVRAAKPLRHGHGAWPGSFACCRRSSSVGSGYSMHACYSRINSLHSIMVVQPSPARLLGAGEAPLLDQGSLCVMQCQFIMVVAPSPAWLLAAREAPLLDQGSLGVLQYHFIMVVACLLQEKHLCWIRAACVCCWSVWGCWQTSSWSTPNWLHPALPWQLLLLLSIIPTRCDATCAVMLNKAGCV